MGLPIVFEKDQFLLSVVTEKSWRRVRVYRQKHIQPVYSTSLRLTRCSLSFLLTLLTMNLANDLPMSHKRKLSYESLPKTLISDGQPSKIPKVDIGNATQDSGSSKPLTFSNASASGTFANTAFSQAASHRYPLTEQNLRQFNKSNKAIESTPDNKSRKTQTTTTFTSEGFHTVFRGLEYNHIYIDKRDAKARGADLIEKARAIIKGERHSALK